MINAVGRDIPDYLLVNGKEVYHGKNYKDGQLVKKASPTTVTGIISIKFIPLTKRPVSVMTFV